MPSITGSTVKGATSGVMSGISAGAALGPIGMGVGAVVGGVIGGISGHNKSKAYQSALDNINNIPLIDPAQLAFQDTLGREKRAVQSGFTTDFQVSRDILSQVNAGNVSVAESVGASNPALAVSMMKASSANMSTGLNQALGTISTRSNSYTQMMQDMVDKIAKRKLDVSMYKTNAELSQTSKEYKDFNTQANSALGNSASAIGSVVGGIKGLNDGTINAWGNQIQK